MKKNVPYLIEHMELLKVSLDKWQYLVTRCSSCLDFPQSARCLHISSCRNTHTHAHTHTCPSLSLTRRYPGRRAVPGALGPRSDQHVYFAAIAPFPCPSAETHPALGEPQQTRRLDFDFLVINFPLGNLVDADFVHCSGVAGWLQVHGPHS